MTYTAGTVFKTVAGETFDAAWVIIAIKERRQNGNFFGGGHGWILEVAFLKMKEWISCNSDFQKCRLLLVRTRRKNKQCYYWFHTLKYQDARLFCEIHVSHIQSFVFTEYFSLEKELYTWIILVNILKH